VDAARSPKFFACDLARCAEGGFSNKLRAYLPDDIRAGIEARVSARLGMR
jgi:hypothetical protein